MKTNRITAIAATVILMMITVTVMAQGGSGPPPPPGGTSGPIDGGVLALVVGAAAYGYRRLKQQSDVADKN